MIRLVNITFLFLLSAVPLSAQTNTVDFTNGVLAQVEAALPKGWTVAYTQCTPARLPQHFGNTQHYFVALRGGLRRLYINRQADACLIFVASSHPVTAALIEKHDAVLLGVTSRHKVFLQKPKEVPTWPTIVEDLRNKLTDTEASNNTSEHIR